MQVGLGDAASGRTSVPRLRPQISTVAEYDGLPAIKMASMRRADPIRPDGSLSTDRGPSYVQALLARQPGLTSRAPPTVWDTTPQRKLSALGHAGHTTAGGATSSSKKL